MKRLVLTLSASLLFLNLFAQTEKDCACKEMMQELIKNVEENYSLFELKVHTSERKKNAYQMFSAALLDLATNTGSRQECQPILRRYIDFFNDGHLWIDFNQDSQPSFQFDRRSPDDMAAWTYHSNPARRSGANPASGWG